MIKTILVPTDGSDHANKAVILASDLAAKYDARITFMHVLLGDATTADIRAIMRERDLPDDLGRQIDEVEEMQVSSSIATEDVYVPIPVPRDLLEAIGNIILDEAVDVAERHGAENVKRILRHGEAAKCILAASDELAVNIIVMGSRGMSDLKGLLVGSVSHKVSHLANCTCVSVK